MLHQRPGSERGRSSRFASLQEQIVVAAVRDQSQMNWLFSLFIFLTFHNTPFSSFLKVDFAPLI